MKIARFSNEVSLAIGRTLSSGHVQILKASGIRIRSTFKCLVNVVRVAENVSSRIMQPCIFRSLRTRRYTLRDIQLLLQAFSFPGAEPTCEFLMISRPACGGNLGRPT